MTAPYAIFVKGMLDFPADPSAEMARNAVRAINRTLERSRTAAGRRIREQVNFPANYLSGQNGRLKITKKAQGRDFEGIITGRHRPTSLATFARNARRGRGVRPVVSVQPGLARRLDGAFFVNLRSGNTDTRNNLGLAIRLPEGQVPDRAYKPQKLGENLWLLYGPSVDQVFDDVAEEISPQSLAFLETEFLRLMGFGNG